MVQQNLEEANVHREMKAAGLVGQNDQGVWAIRGGDNLAEEASKSKEKAQLLNVSKGKQ